MKHVEQDYGLAKELSVSQCSPINQPKQHKSGRGLVVMYELLLNIWRAPLANVHFTRVLYATAISLLPMVPGGRELGVMASLHRIAYSFIFDAIDWAPMTSSWLSLV